MTPSKQNQTQCQEQPQEQPQRQGQQKKQISPLRPPSAKSGRNDISARSGGEDLEGAHHLVGFVFEEMAVPGVAACVSVKADDDAGDGTGEGADGVFPAHFAGLGVGYGAGPEEFFVHAVFVDVEIAAIEHLEADHVEMDGVGVVGEVDEAPDFG
jgi:hypothetical protein